jgi:hypothetical protein
MKVIDLPEVKIGKLQRELDSKYGDLIKLSVENGSNENSKNLVIYPCHRSHSGNTKACIIDTIKKYTDSIEYC